MKKTVKQITLILLSVAIISSILAVSIVAIFFDPPIPIERTIREVNFAYACALGLVLTQTILALSIYLNLFKTIRNNRLFSALSFFLLPMLFLLGLLLENLSLDTTLFFSIIDIPFFTLLLLGFLWFRKINSQ